MQLLCPFKIIKQYLLLIIINFIENSDRIEYQILIALGRLEIWNIILAMEFISWKISFP